MVDGRKSKDQRKKSMLHYLKLGFKYALLFILVAFVMGIIYGALGGVFLAPAFAFVSLVGVFVILNFPIAAIALLINILLHPFKKSSLRTYRYFTFSFCFLVVFGFFFLIMKLSEFTIY